MPHPSWNAGCTWGKERPSPFLLHLVPGCLRSLLQGPELPARKVRRPSAVPDPSVPGAAEPQPQREEETGVPQLAATDVSVRSLPSQMLSISQLRHPSPHIFLSAPCVSSPFFSPCLSLSLNLYLCFYFSFSCLPHSLCLSVSISLPLSPCPLSVCVLFHLSLFSHHYLSLVLCVSLTLSLSASASVSVFSPHFLSLSHLFLPPSLSLFLPKPVKNAQCLVPGKGLGGGGGESCYWEISRHERPLPAPGEGWGGGEEVSV